MTGLGGGLADARSALDISRAAEHAYLKLGALIGRGDAAQFVHRYVRTDEKYTVRHEREGCEACDALDAIWLALDAFRERVFADAEGSASKSADHEGA